MKNNYLSKSRWLLLLFALIVGSGTAWADAYTCGFEQGTDGWNQVYENYTYTLTPGDGWALKGASAASSYRVGNSYYRSGNTGLYFIGSDGNTSNYIITPKLKAGTLTFYGKYTNSSSCKFVLYSCTKENDVYTVGSQLKSFNNDLTSSYQQLTYNLADDGYVAILLYRCGIDDFTASNGLATAIVGPAFAVKDGSTTLSSPYAYNFGLATDGTTKVFTLSNPGTETVEGLSVAKTGDFGATLSATSIAAGESATLTVTMPASTGNSAITISSTTEGIADFVINASGTVRDPNKVFENDFSSLPEDWTTTGSWSYSAANGAYTTAWYTSSNARLVTPKLTIAEGEKFFVEAKGYSTSNTSYQHLQMQYSSDGTTWTNFDSEPALDPSNWKTFEFTGAPAGSYYIAINASQADIRMFYGGQLPLNPTPKSLGYSNVTNTSAQLNWTSTASNFNIQYKASGDADWTTIENVTANPYTLTGLSAVTTYQVKVQADHGVNGLSDYTDAISFTTKPNPISAYPYTENFNSLSSGEIPTYWDNSQGTTETASYKWVYYATGHDGACVRFDSYNNSSNKTNFLKTRPFNFTQGQPMKLTFWYKNPTGGDFSVYASTDGGATYPTELATGLTGKSDWTESEIDIPASVYGDNVVVVFKGTSNWGSGDAYIYLDDVVISEVSDYSLSISGSDVSENTIAFGTVKNTTTTKTFTITNDGGSDLTDISVVSGDAEVFTVSDTGFDLASGATKVITVTFVKAVDGNYSKTITISQANIATPIVLTATAKYATPTPATMAVTLDDVAVGETVAFGTVNKSTTKTFKVSNAGEATLNATIELSGTDAAKFTLSTDSLVVAGGANETFTVTFDSDDEDVAKTATVTLSAAGLSNIAFNVTGTYVNFWEEDFEGGTLPDFWATTGWTVTTSAYSGNGTYMAYAGTSSSTLTLTTPRLQATAGDELTFFVGGGTDGTDKLTVEYSNDLSSWTAIEGSPFTSGGTKTFTAPADGYYYLKFNGKYASVDNFSGFKLAIPDHILAITASNIPSSGIKVGKSFNATVTVSELRGVAEEVTAKVYVKDDPDDEEIGTVTETVSANGTKQLTIVCTPTLAGDDVEMYIAVTYAGGTLTTVAVTRDIEIPSLLQLDEESTDEIPTGSSNTYDIITLNRTYVTGWNTIVLPLSTPLDDFGADAIAYEFTGYEGGELRFTKVTSTMLNPATPYLLYLTDNLVGNIQWENQYISSLYVGSENIKTTNNGVIFQGTYAPIAAGAWTKNDASDVIYGVTSAGKIAKAGASASMKGFRAYFDVPAGASVKGMSLFDGDDATSINGIALEGMEEGQLYDLSGRRVNPATTRLNGIYILNGKKIIIK